MTATVHPATISGRLRVPASKSHTIRALLIASLASGESVVENVLQSRDTAACIAACRALGADIGSMPTGTPPDRAAEEDRPPDAVRVVGTGGSLHAPDDIIDVGNSGTTLYLALGIAALCEGWTFFTGDEQIRRRSAAPLLASLRDLGAEAFSSRDNGCAPIAVRGPLAGGTTTIECPTSQYLSSLLLAAPLAASPSEPRTTPETEIRVPLLNERPYVEMTLWWLESQGIRLDREGQERFRIPGGQSYRAFTVAVPGDYSSATFWMVAAAVTGGSVTLDGLDPNDPQGDKAVLDILAKMGCTVERPTADAVTVSRPSRLSGGTFDLNAVPDALPGLTVAACLADSPTTLMNVPQAREKETDRVAVMARELGTLGARIEERPDGLVVHPPARLTGGNVSGHGDHRVVMALAIAGLAATGPVIIDGSEAADVTYPGFFDDLRRLTERA